MSDDNKDLAKLLRLFEDHNHDGLDSRKINASGIELNSHNLKLIKATKVSEAIKIIDSSLDNKQEKIIGKNGNILIFENDKLSEIEASMFSKKDHVHTDFVIKPQGDENEIVIFKDKVLQSSKINIKDLVKKDSIDNLSETLMTIKKEIVLQKDHDHFDSVKKITGKREFLISDENGNLFNTGIKPDDVVLKKDIENIVNGIVSQKLNIFKQALELKAEKTHSHLELDSGNLIKREEFKQLLKNSVKEILGES